MELPLSDVRVLTVEQFGAAPYATMFLADFGAEVIKIEQPEGDFARHTTPLSLGENDSLYFQSFNLNKKSMVLDLARDEDRARFGELARHADVVINNLRGTQAAKLGLDYASLSQFNPAIVCGHITAYGRNNSRAGRPGFDFLMQAEAGLMSMTGEPDAAPARAGVSIIDYMAGMMLAYGVVAALHRSRATGRGGDIDACLFDTALHQLAYQACWYLNDGLVTTRAPRSAHPTNTPTQLFRTRDGWVYVAAMTDKFWTKLCDALGHGALAHDARFVTRDLRLENRVALTTELDRLFAARDTDEWVELLGDAVPLAPVLGLGDALDADFVSETGMIDALEHPARSPLRVLANPLRIDGQRLPRKRAPALGENDGEFADLTKPAR